MTKTRTQANGDSTINTLSQSLKQNSLGNKDAMKKLSVSAKTINVTQNKNSPGMSF